MSQRPLTRIMHVDDESDIREIVRLVLAMIGRFTVVSCASGQQAIDKAPEFRPDIILMDVMMPGMSGPETLANLRAQDPSVDAPVIFMTAKGEMAEMEHLRTLGALDVIAKPFDPMMVSEQITRIWARHAGH